MSVVSLAGFFARLTADASPSEVALRIGPVAAGLLAARLVPGQWAYAFLRGGCGVEVVKVTGAGADFAIVQRGMSRTDRRAFAAGDTLDYEFTYAEAEDRLTALGVLGLALTGQASVTATPSGQVYKIGVPEIVISVTCAAEVVGQYALEIGKRIEAYGCCDIQLPALPAFVYLTSRPYPVDAIEAISTTGIVLSGMFIRPTRIAIAATGLVLSGEMRELLRSSVAVDEAITTTGLVLSGEMRVLLLSSAAVDEAITTTGLVLAGEMRILLIQYPMVDEAITTTGLVLSGHMV